MYIEVDRHKVFAAGQIDTRFAAASRTFNSRRGDGSQRVGHAYAVFHARRSARTRLGSTRAWAFGGRRLGFDRSDGDMGIGMFG